MPRLYLGPPNSDFDPAADVVIGPWCLMGTKYADDLPSSLEFVEPFETSAEMARAADHCADLIAYYVGCLSSQLNARHGCERGIPFWWTVLVPWLLHLVEASWRHWVLAEKMVERYGDKCFTVCVPATENADRRDFTDTRDFLYRGLRSPDFIARLTARFLSRLSPAKWCQTEIPPSSCRQDETRASLAPNKNSLLKRVVGRLFSRLPARNLPGISAASIPLSLYIALLPRRTSTQDFGGVIPSSPPTTFPPAYLEELEQLIEETLPHSLGVAFASFDIPATRLRYYPRRLFVTAPTIFANDHCFEIAHALEAGERVVRTQHGSEYGVAETFNGGWMNEYVNAAFLSWGWSRHNNFPGRFLPVAAPALSRLRNRHRARSSKVLLIGTAMVLVPFRLRLWQQPSRMFEYRKDKLHFIEALHESARKNLAYRPYLRGRVELSESEWLRRHVGPLEIVTGELDPALLSCRLAVIDHPGTTMHIALAANVPTVCYWQSDLFVPCSDAKPYFDALREAGILHEGPHSAAAHVNAIADDVPGWWSSAETQAARRRWVSQFARTDRVWWWHWLQALARV